MQALLIIHLCEKMSDLCSGLSNILIGIEVNFFLLGEDIHEQRDIDEIALESDISHIAHPDLIASTDVKRLQAIHPRTHTRKGGRGLTDTFDGNREVLGFHQSGNAPIPNGVSLMHQQLCDTPIPVRRIRHS